MDLGKPIIYRNITLIPLLGESSAYHSYTLGTSAVDEFKLIITEIDEEGKIHEVLATSTHDKEILLLEGEVLIGAKKNRLLNSSVLMPAYTFDQKIPVTCVEKNRWNYNSRKFICGNYAPPRIRKHINTSVYNKLQQNGDIETAQHQLWRLIKQLFIDFNIETQTVSLNDIYDHQQMPIEEFLTALQYPEGARGVVAVINGQFVTLDIFDQPLTLQKIWDKLLVGLIIEALTADTPVKNDFRQNDVKDMLNYLLQVPWKSFPPIGLGQEFRFQDKHLSGQSLIASDVCVHMSVFPANNQAVNQSNSALKF